MVERLGEYLSRELKNKNLNQADLARMAGTTEATISRIIREERQPSIPMCHAIAKALNVPANVILSKAGIVATESNYTDLVKTIAYKVSALPEKDQAVVLKIVEALAER